MNKSHTSKNETERSKCGQAREDARPSGASSLRMDPDTALPELLLGQGYSARVVGEKDETKTCSEGLRDRASAVIVSIT